MKIFSVKNLSVDITYLGRRELKEIKKKLLYKKY